MSASVCGGVAGGALTRAATRGARVSPAGPAPTRRSWEDASCAAPGSAASEDETEHSQPGDISVHPLQNADQKGGPQTCSRGPAFQGANAKFRKITGNQLPLWPKLNSAISGALTPDTLLPDPRPLHARAPSL